MLKNPRQILLIKDKKGLSIVNNLIFTKDGYAEPVTPSFDSFETAKVWLKDNKKYLKDGQYFLATVSKNGKVTIENKIN